MKTIRVIFSLCAIGLAAPSPTAQGADAPSTAPTTAPATRPARVRPAPLTRASSRPAPIKRGLVAAENDPKYFELRKDGFSALARGDYVTALRSLGLYIDRYDSDVKAQESFVVARLKIEDIEGQHFTAATRVLRRMCELKPDDMDFRRQLADALIKGSQFAEAIKVSDAILSRLPGDPVALRHKARALGSTGAMEQALKFVRESVAKAPLDVESYLLLVEVTQSLGSSDGLLPIAQDVYKNHPGDVRAELILGVAYRAVNNRPEAKKILALANEHAPLDAASIVTLVIQMEWAGMYAEALKLLEVSAKRSDDPTLVKLYYRRAWENNRWIEIEQRLGKLDPKTPTSDPELVALRIMSISMLDKPKDAADLTMLFASRRLNAPVSAWITIIKEFHLSRKPDPHKVIEACQLLARVNPQSTYVRYALGEAYAFLGETDQAVDAWRMAYQLSPGWSVPLSRLSTLLVERGRTVPAADLAEMAFRRAPEDLKVAGILAHAWAANIENADENKCRELLKIVELVQRQNPREPQTLPLNVMLLAKLGRKDDARALLAGALATRDSFTEPILIRLAQASRFGGLNLQSECFERSRSAWGESPTLLREMAVDLHRSGKIAQADAVFANRIKPPSATAEWLLAYVRYLEEAKDPRAGPAWIRLADEPSLASYLPLHRGVMDSRGFVFDRALQDRTIERLRKITGDVGVEWRMARVRWLLSAAPAENELREAGVLLTQALALIPTDVAVRMQLAATLEKLGGISSAIEHYRICSQLSPSNLIPTAELARLYTGTGQLQQARAAIEQLRKIASKDSVDDAIVLSRVLVLFGKKASLPELQEEGRAILKKWGDREDAPEYALVNYATMENDFGNLKTAEAIYRRCIAKYPNSLTALNNLAMLLADQNRDLDEAADFARRVVAGAPHVAITYDTLAHVLLIKKDYPGAVTAMRQAIKIEPANVSWRLNLARVLHEQDRKEEVKTELADLDAMVRKRRPPMTSEQFQLWDELKQKVK